MTNFKTYFLVQQCFLISEDQKSKRDLKIDLISWTQLWSGPQKFLDFQSPENTFKLLNFRRSNIKMRLLISWSFHYNFDLLIKKIVISCFYLLKFNLLTATHFFFSFLFSQNILTNIFYIWQLVEWSKKTKW